MNCYKFNRNKIEKLQQYNKFINCSKVKKILADDNGNDSNESDIEDDISSDEEDEQQYETINNYLQDIENKKKLAQIEYDNNNGDFLFSHTTETSFILTLIKNNPKLKTLQHPKRGETIWHRNHWLYYFLNDSDSSIANLCDFYGVTVENNYINRKIESNTYCDCYYNGNCEGPCDNCNKKTFQNNKNKNNNDNAYMFSPME
ncbi:hypothetical protein GpSGHVEth088 [Glossina pallidipes salivary gland hypertrophy virus]|uniref:Uncharacterized protein n=1 Tax=Glossina hytrovirus (isolate Glossina pallidipes/Ethiopia/Seibersdorf/-) TaxID=379529 RepID=A0A0Y0JE07_GHVS|nr:hypothetical protein GpSGHVEth088 [Glossina pallidipes salivary gland hypertrophy virus]